MDTAAQLKAVVAYLDDTDDVAVFFTEEGHGSHSFGFINRLVLDHNVQAAPDLGVHTVFDVA
ncbi:hypothetical protein D3C81_2218720 [compost metagenome]